MSDEKTGSLILVESDRSFEVIGRGTSERRYFRKVEFIAAHEHLFRRRLVSRFILEALEKVGDFKILLSDGRFHIQLIKPQIIDSVVHRRTRYEVAVTANAAAYFEFHVVFPKQGIYVFL